MITSDDLAKAHTSPVVHLDGQGFYENHSQCVEYPRLTIVDRGRRGKPRKDVKFGRIFFVDGTECADLDAALTLLNAEPSAKPAREASP
jgi:hypothetical protein